jgi:hypothetical protein
MKKGNDHQPFQQNYLAEKGKENKHLNEERLMEERLTSRFEQRTHQLFLISSTFGLRSSEIKELFILNDKGGR